MEAHSDWDLTLVDRGGPPAGIQYPRAVRIIVKRLNRAWSIGKGVTPPEDLTIEWVPGSRTRLWVVDATRRLALYDIKAGRPSRVKPGHSPESEAGSWGPPFP